MGVTTTRSGSGARPGRLSRHDWVEAALEVIATQGLAAVAVEPLAARLGVTKGSFYAHFDTRAELVDAALQRWKREDTDEVVASLAGLADPGDRLRRFLDLGFRRQYWGRVFAALCASAADPRVDPVMTQVRQARLAYLEAALVELGMNTEDAHDRATAIYATYVGYWRLVAADEDWEYNSPEARARMAAHLEATLLPPR